MNNKTYKTTLTIEIKKINEKVPNFSVRTNTKLVEPSEKIDENIINFSFESVFGDNLIEVNFTNKSFEDTIIDSQGNIVEDLAVIILKLDVDGFDLSDRLKSNCKYLDENNNLQDTYGYMSKNGKLSFNYICPPFYFLKQSDY